MVDSYRKTDMKAEETLGRFMDRCFYKKLCASNHLATFERKEDVNVQLSGVDVELNINGVKYLIDEKAALYYSNAMIPTFAFEIDSIQKNHEFPVPGWFINQNLQTDYYMLIWPNVKCEMINNIWRRKNLEQLNDRDFTIVEAMLIKKSTLFEELEKMNCSLERLKIYAKKLREQMAGRQETERSPCEGNDNIKIVYSGKIKEQPINLVINKKILKSLAVGMWLIAEDGYATISLFQQT